MASATKVLLQFCSLGVTMSLDDGFLGARASRPTSWRSLGHLPDLETGNGAMALRWPGSDAVRRRQGGCLHAQSH